MLDMMQNVMGDGMWGMGIGNLLVLAVIVLAIAALRKIRLLSLEC
jgi:hypothetical protein